MPEDLELSKIGSSQLPPPFRGLHSPGVRKTVKLSLPVISGNRQLSDFIMLTTCVCKLHQCKFMLQKQTKKQTKKLICRQTNNHLIYTFVSVSVLMVSFTRSTSRTQSQHVSAYANTFIHPKCCILAQC